jgi:hypothetical protein
MFPLLQSRRFIRNGKHQLDLLWLVSVCRYCHDCLVYAGSVDLPDMSFLIYHLQDQCNNLTGQCHMTSTKARIFKVLNTQKASGIMITSAGQACQLLGSM